MRVQASRPLRAIAFTLVLAAFAATSLVASTAIAAPRSIGGAPSRAARPHAGTCKSTITLCALKVLAPAGGTEGVYLKQLGGAVLASRNPSYAFEPASAIKPVIALYALTQVLHGKVKLTTEIPKISTAGGSEDCPPATISGQETLGAAIQQMLQVSDNNRTRELMQYFGVTALNAFIKSLGMTSSHFQTSATPPGFNVIGCNSYTVNTLPASLDGNTLSLSDLGILWSKIAALPAPYANVFYALAAGREMSNSVGYDYTGIWPDVVNLVHGVAPTGLTAAQVSSFIDHAQLSVKGGSYDWYVCQSGSSCERSWADFAVVAYFPSCSGTTMKQTEYVASDFVSAATTSYASTPISFNVTGPAIATLLKVPVANALATWETCAPRSSPLLHVHGETVKTSRTVSVPTTLATVTDSDRTDIGADLLATISWGDGTSSQVATVSGGKGLFKVHGWHVYKALGVHTVKITVKSEATGATTTGSSKVEVS